MTHRERLPNRRQHELISFQHAGINYVAGIGRFADGRLAEVFLNGAKCGTDAHTSAKDAAIVAPLTQPDLARAIRAAQREGASAIEVHAASQGTIVIRLSPSTGEEKPIEADGEIVL